MSPAELIQVMRGAVKHRRPSVDFCQDLLARAAEALEAAAPVVQAAEQQAGVPIDMVLHCPACGLQHVDGPEPRFADNGEDDTTWINPPHRSHLCHGCGHIWRPADVLTNGVQAVKTTGKADSPAAHRAQQAGASHEDIANNVVQMVCDMDDRSSPEDQPEMMLVTGPELHSFVLTALEKAADRQPSETIVELAVRTLDEDAVDCFAHAMKVKLAKARAKGRGGWQNCSTFDLSCMLREHVEKGDPTDVANFAMFLWSLGSGIVSLPPVDAPANPIPQADPQ